MSQFLITLSKQGFVSKISLETFNLTKRATQGVQSFDLQSQDSASLIVKCSAQEHLLLFSNKGKVYKIALDDIEESTRSDYSFIDIATLISEQEEGEFINSIIPMLESEYSETSFLLFATKFGFAKKCQTELFLSSKSTAKKAIVLTENDELISVIKTDDKSEILLSSSNARLARFHANDLLSRSKNSQGCICLALDKGEQLVSASSTQHGTDVISISLLGLGKMSPVEEFRLSKRGALGVLCQKVTEKTGKLLISFAASQESEILLLTSAGRVNRFKVSEVSKTSRSASGVVLIKLLSEKETVVSATVIHH